MNNDAPKLGIEMAESILSDAVYICRQVGIPYKDAAMLQFVTTLMLSCDQQLENQKSGGCCQEDKSEFSSQIKIAKGQ